MSGCGKKRATRSGPADDQSGGGDQIRQILTELMAPVVERIGAIEGVLAGIHTTPPSPTPETPITPTGVMVTAPGPDGQKQWMKMLERYQKLRAPEFQGGFDPLVANKWKEDVSCLLELMGVDPVQSHRLAAFSLKGDARLWYKVHFTKEEMTTVT